MSTRQGKEYPFRCWMMDGLGSVNLGEGEDLMIAIEHAAEFRLTALGLYILDPHALIPYRNFPALPARMAEDKRDLAIRVFRRFCKSCREHTLEPYVMTSELAHLKEIAAVYPDALNPNKPLLWEITAARVAETFELFPDLAGIEIWLDEGDETVNVSHVAALPNEFGSNPLFVAMPAPEIVARLVYTYLRVCRKFKKKLIVMTFSNRAYRQRDIQAGLKLVPPSPDLFVNHWVVPGDWSEYMVHHPCIGDVGGHQEIISFDFSAELWGQATVPFCYPDYIKERWSDALSRSRNIVGYNGWAYWNWHAGNPQGSSLVIGKANEVNALAMACWAQNPALEVDAVWDRWIGKYVSDPAAATAVKSALKRTQRIGEKAWMLKGFPLMEWPKSDLPGLRFALHTPYRESPAQWDASLQPLEDSIFFPTNEFLRGIMRDREEAMALAQQSLDEMVAVASRLPAPWGPNLWVSLDRLVAFCRTSRWYTELFFRWKLWWLGRPGGEPAEIERCIDRLAQVADENEAKFGKDLWPGNPARARLFIRQIRAMMSFGRSPVKTWSGIFVTTLGKRYAHGILELLATVAEDRSQGTGAEHEQTLLDQAERLKQQLLGLAIFGGGPFPNFAGPSDNELKRINSPKASKTEVAGNPVTKSG